MNVSDTVRRAVVAYPASRNVLAARAGILPSTISRFMAGRPMTTDNLDKLCPVLGLKLRPVVNRRKDGE